MRYTATTLIDGIGTPESLRWHNGALWFSDIAHGTVHQWTRDGGITDVVAVPGRACGMGWLPDGRLLVNSMDEQLVYRLENDGTLAVHADLSDITTGPVNDMVVDQMGRAYVGSFGFDYYAHLNAAANSSLYAPPGPPRAPIVTLNPDGSRHHVTDPVMFPNGATITPTGTLIFAETYGLRLTEFDLAEDGTPSQPRTWAPLVSDRLWKALTSAGLVGTAVRTISALLDHPEIAKRSSSPIAPDGITLHTDDETIWVANALRGEAVRVARGGKIIDRVKTSQYTLDVTIGDDGRTLFIATAAHLDPREARKINQGRIEMITLPA